tara:strand:- start:1255 stop:1551 length:297 start_codon:yes stop_codon:yes gene_type:complete
MKKIEQLVLNVKLSIKASLVIFLIFISCSAPSNNNECNDCGGGMIDGYLYKKVTLDDITASLIEIEPSIIIDQCIRYKMDEVEFMEASIVDECCCTIY